MEIKNKQTYQVSALKYRPKSFDEVVGQETITKTLNYAIEKNKLPQALLFSGPRGVGKTSCARILAKKINSNEINNYDFSFNIFELDAASNNHVDDIKSLNEQVRIPPQNGNYKVFIIDEVHMLSTSAFNAFLKTLEEPPKHAIFILATTEKQKIIPTILSRCQIYDFKRISIKDCKSHLAKIANNQNVKYEEEALALIAQKSDGALRDALYLYDQMIAFTKKELSMKNVSESLNLLTFDTYFKISDLIINNDIPKLLVEFDHIISNGYDELEFIIGLANHFRNIVLIKNKQTSEMLEIDTEFQKKYFSLSEKLIMHDLLKIIDLINKCELDHRDSKNKRLLIELCLMQIASLRLEEKTKDL